MHRSRWFLAAVVAASGVYFTGAAPMGAKTLSNSSAPAQQGQLEARAVLPAATVAPGPPSGAFIEPGTYNGVTPPFPQQPVQGFSGIWPAGGGLFWAMPDNGYGQKGNSADWLLRIYRIHPDFKTAAGGSGGASVVGFIPLRDPDGQLSFPLVRQDRLLTGADVDPESIFQLPDGTFWIGDEFGPWMLHFDAAGRLLQPPGPLPGVKSPQNPGLAPGEAPTPGRRQGFDGA